MRANEALEISNKSSGLTSSCSKLQSIYKIITQRASRGHTHMRYKHFVSPEMIKDLTQNGYTVVLKKGWHHQTWYVDEFFKPYFLTDEVDFAGSIISWGFCFDR